MMNKKNRQKGSRILAMILAASMVISLGADVSSTTNVYAAESQVITEETSTQTIVEGEGKTVADENSSSDQTITEGGSASDSNANANTDTSSDDTNTDESGDSSDASDKKTTDTNASDNTSTSDDKTATDNQKDQSTNTDTSDKDASATDTTKDTDKKTSDSATTESTETDEDAEDDETEIEQSETSSCYVLEVTERTVSRVRRASGALLRNANSNDASTAYDFGSSITSSTTERKNGNEWVKSDEFTDGDSIRVTLNFSIGSNIVTANQKAITYQLPSGLCLTKDETGYAMRRGEDGTTYAVGTYVITTDGRITITYYDEFADGKEFTGSIQFEGTLDYSQTEEKGKIEFDGNGGTITIKEQPTTYSISTAKSGSYNAETNKLSYTITTSTGENGTDPEKTITVEDWFSSGVDNATYDTDSFIIKKVDKDGNETNVTETYKSNLAIADTNKHFTLTGLPALEANEKYIIEYTATPGTLPEGSDGSQKVGNYATSYDGSNNSNSSVDVTIHESKLHKTGSYDSVNDLITWTIEVNKGHETMNNYKVTDELPQGLTIQGDVTVTETKKEGSAVTSSWTKDDESTGSKLVYTFTGDSMFTLTFKTNAPESTTAGTVTTVSNTARGNDGASSTGTTSVKKREWSVTKNFGYETTRTGLDPTLTWNINITVPAGEQTEIVYTDTIHDPVSSDSSDDTDKTGQHYTTWSDLNKISPSYQMRDNADSKGISYAIKAYTAKDGDEISSSDTSSKIGYWIMTFTIPDAVKDKVANIAFSYDTTVVYDNIPNDKTWTYKNTGAVGEHEATAEYSHTKPKAIRKSAGTNIGSQKWAVRDRNGETSVGASDFNSGSSSLTMNEDGTFWYRLVISTTSKTTGNIEITDTLEDGLAIADLEKYLNDDADADGYRTLKIDSNYAYDSNSPLLIYMANDKSQQANANYRVEELARVKYDATTRKLSIIIPYDGKNGASYQYWYGSAPAQVPFFEILYKVSVSEDSDIWKDMGDKLQHTFHNKAEWGVNSDETNTDVTKEKERLIKSAELIQKEVKNEDGTTSKVDTTSVEYSIIINPSHENLDPDSDFLELTDQLGTITGEWGSTMSNVKVRFLLENLALYAYDASAENHRGQKLDKSLYKVSEFDDTNHSFKITIPDQLACVLVYQYEFDATGYSSGTKINISNSASLNGKWSKTNKQQIAAQSSRSDVDYDTVYVYKVDSKDYNTRLDGVLFTLQSWQAQSTGGSQTTTWQTVTGGHGENGTFKTQDGGKLTLQTKDSTEDAKLNRNVLYRLQETSAGPNTGYAVRTTPMYFMLGDSESEAKSAFEALGTVTDTVDGKAKTVTWSDVEFCDIKYSGSAEIYFEDDYTAISVEKIWQDKNGNTLSADETAELGDIKVQLVQNATTPGTEGHTVDLSFVNKYDSGTVQASKSLLVKEGGVIKVTYSANNKNVEDVPDVDGWTTTWEQDGTAWKVIQTSNPINSDSNYTLSRAWDWSYGYDVAYDKPTDITSSKDYGDPVTLNSANSWKYSWPNSLPKTDEATGATFTYSVREITTGAYKTSYLNNDGIQAGTITIYNRMEEVYKLPETGGSGTVPYTAGGTAAVVLSLLSGAYMIRRRKYTLGN